MSRGLRAAGLALLLLGCTAPPPPIDAEGWLEIQGRPFTLVGNLEEEEMRQLAKDLSLFDAVVRRVTNTRIEASRVPVRLYVVREGAYAHRLLPDYAQGVTYRSLDGYYMVLEPVDPDFFTRQVLLHEYSHYVLLGGRYSGLPTWYNEGLCEFLAYLELREDMMILGRSATPRLQELDRHGIWPLEAIFGTEGYPGSLQGFYATSWALAHHLNTSSELNASSRAFVQRLLQGEDWPAAFDASFSLELSEFEASLAAHVAFLQGGGRLDLGLPLETLGWETDPIVRPLEPGEVAYQLGTLTRRIADEPGAPGDVARMRAFFQQAVAADPGHSRARAALAWTWAAGGDTDRALEEIARVAPRASDDPEVALDYARIAAIAAAESPSDEGSAAALRLLERAIALSPSDPESHAALARHLAREGEHGAAIAAFEKARELGAWSPSLDVALAREHLAVGAGAGARRLLRAVAADPHGGRATEEARALLGDLEEAD